MAFLLALFGAITVQKNVRDGAAYDEAHPSPDAGLEGETRGGLASLLGDS